MARRASKTPHSLPSKEEILEFIQSSQSTVSKREIARAFGVKGGTRIELKKLLKEMADEGLISGTRKRLTRPGSLPSVAVLQIVGRDQHGEFVAIPVNWDSETHGDVPKILIEDTKSGTYNGSASGIGDRILARIKPLSDDDGSGINYSARTIKRLANERGYLLGIYREVKGRGGVIDPIDRKQLKEWPVPKGDEGGATEGELVRIEIMKAGRFGLSKARVVECLGNPEDQKSVSLIAIEKFGIPNIFPDETAKDLAALEPPDPTAREDLRPLPLLTIDPPDARDHDDAVWAAPDEDPKNKDGWVIIVAIADVAHYVRPGSSFDREALKRGNSVYFPDRVVPMLPEKISNDLCSLREGEDRPCLAVRMVFDGSGNKKNHRFMRAAMRSRAKLSYLQAQSAIDGKSDDKTAPLLDTILTPLWGAYSALKRARTERSPLDLDLPERKLVINAQGLVEHVEIPERLEAHRLIEEFMIQANVCAAETLESRNAPVIYRVHDAPSKEKLINLRDFLTTLDINIPKAGKLKPKQFNQILERARDTEISELINETILRAQSQAEYHAANYGHFGLNLRRYAHFTSPIRRYADLLVHRSLITALKLGPDGISEEQIDKIDEIAEAISDTERRAMAAERETVDRLIAYYLADRIGGKFNGKVSGVARSGLFVRLDETGADGFVSASTLGRDYYVFDESSQALIGEQTGETFRLGDRVEVRLVEAIPTAGALRFEILSEGRIEKSPRKQKFKIKKRRTNRRKRSR